MTLSAFNLNTYSDFKRVLKCFVYNLSSYPNKRVTVMELRNEDEQTVIGRL